MKPFLLVVGCLLLATQATAGAWARPRGTTYAKLSTLTYAADEIYNDMGDRQRMGMDDEEFTGRQGFLYVEHGWREGLTLVGQLSGGVLTSSNRLVRQRTRGIGDAELGLKVQLLDEPLVLSSMLVAKIPTGYHHRYDPPLGTGEADLEARLLAGRSLWPLPLYLGAEVGYRFRGGPFSNQLAAFAEVGATPHERLFVKGFVDVRDTRSRGTQNLGLVGAGQQVSEGDVTRVGLNGAILLYRGVWVDLLVEGAVGGENVGAGATWGIGLSCGG